MQSHRSAIEMRSQFSQKQKHRPPKWGAVNVMIEK